MNLRGKLSTFMRHSLLWVVVAVSPLFIYTNCGDSSHDQYSGNSEGINTTAILNTLRSQKNSVLNNKCASCHNELTVDNNLRNVLDTEYLDANNYINLGSPQTSPLYLRIVDGFMPPSGSPDVTDAELAVLRDWIAAEGGDFDTYIGGTPIGGGGTSPFVAVRTVMNQNCTSCHRAGGVAPRLDVDAATLRGTMYQGRRLVIPNDASGSLLLQSFSGMPTGGALGVNSAEANAVRAWINSGAQ